ncbi:MAG: hypothetical protein IKG27_02985 [Bacilli bacterium]|nr:hypothetical protein [Bacilli bacterium]
MEKEDLKLQRRFHNVFKAFDYVVDDGEKMVSLLDSYDEQPKKYDVMFIMWLRDAVKCRSNLKKLAEDFIKNNLDTSEIDLKISYLNDMIDFTNNRYDCIYERNWALDALDKLEVDLTNFNNQFEVLSMRIRLLDRPIHYVLTFYNNMVNLLESGNRLYENLFEFKSKTKFLNSYSSFDVDEALYDLDKKIDTIENVYMPIFEFEPYNFNNSLENVKKHSLSKEKVNS